MNHKDIKTQKHENLWTNSLFLYTYKVVVKTYDHKEGEWMDGMRREIHWKK